jgi:hypothetical protein|tara:strand:+ start:283 stop:432 length:150 start_codon:yes stop_codon:yes gene_type:complete
MKPMTKIEPVTDANYNPQIAGLAQSGVPTKEDIAAAAAEKIINEENDQI